MKIEKSRLHPLYDQYSNEENRLTHALLHTIGSSNRLFVSFLKNLLAIQAPSQRKTYEICTQKTPLSLGDDDPIQVESIPDAWIVDEEREVGVAVEIKDRRDSLSVDQLRKHAKRIAGCKHRYLLAITPDLQEPSQTIGLKRKEGKRLNVVWRSWEEVYRWLGDWQDKKAKKSVEEFLVASLREYLERRRSVLGFQGIEFPSGFEVSEAKTILNLEMEELQPTVRKVYKNLARRRPAITTFSSESVWDCFGSEDGFTNDLHITLSINEKYHDISLTVPNSARKAWSRLKTVFSDHKEQDKLFLILISLRKEVPHLYIEFIQRHFKHRKFSVRDGYMEFDVDTIDPRFRTNKSKAKEFPVWFDAITQAIVNKKRINGQVMFKSRFFLNETKGIDKPQFIDTARDTVKAFKPLYTFLRRSGGNY